MDDEHRNEGPDLRDSGDGDPQQTPEHSTGLLRDAPKPGEANPALAETESYAEGKISTAEFLRARGSAEAQLRGASADRDKGLAGGHPLHGSYTPSAHTSGDLPASPQLSGRLYPAPLTPPAHGVRSDEDLYDEEESHVMHEDPEMHLFAPHMLNVPSEEKEEKE
jgi:hypothetical protein